MSSSSSRWASSSLFCCPCTGGGWPPWRARFTSVAIEAVQYLLLSQRQASFRDVTSNALGALLGALVIRLARTRPPARNVQLKPSPGTPKGTSDMTTVADSADVAETASIGEGTRIWHLSQIREGAVLGKNCNIGRGAYVGPGVQVGDKCKLAKLCAGL